MEKPFVITIVGAESSGKTTLARHLADLFGCAWVPEYARKYLQNLGRDYNEEDLRLISEGQFEEIQDVSQRLLAPNPLNEGLFESDYARNSFNQSSINLIKSKIQNRLVRHALSQPGATAHQPSKILIVDGGMMNLRMWARIKYKMTIPIVEVALEDDVTDLYILCRPHKEWEPDALREAPSLLERAWIYNQYLSELVKSEYEFEIIRY